MMMIIGFHINCQTRLSSRRGNALILVILLFFILSILTMGILAVANAEHAQIIAEEKIDQAYYKARAVVQATADWMYYNKRLRDDMAKVIPDRTLLGWENRKEINSKLDATENDYYLAIWRDEHDEDLIHIQATATYQGQSAKASMTIQETVSDYVLFEDAIYSKGPFGEHASGTSNLVVGSVATAADTIPDNLNADSYRTRKVFEFPDIGPYTNLEPPPVYADYIPSEVLDASEYMNLSDNLNAHYGSLTLSGGPSNVVYIRNTNSIGQAKDVYIWIENLDADAETTIVPTNLYGGRIFIYITKTVNIQQQINIVGDDINTSYEPRVYFICSNECAGTFNMEGNAHKYLYFYGPNISMEFRGCDGFYGAVIADIFGWTGNLGVEYRQPSSFNGTPFAGLDDEAGQVSVNFPTWYKD